MKQIPSPNFFKGHKKRLAVVLHVSGGTISSMDSWFSTPKSQVSAHYGISKTGEIHQYVSEDNSSWAVGVVKKPTWKLLPKDNPNYYTISIEHEGFKNTMWTNAMEKASNQLVMDICKRNNIPIDREHIIGHYEIDNQKPFIKSKVDNAVKSILASVNPVKQNKIKQKLLILLLMKVVQLLKRLLLKK